jgi:hypothetical protein
MSCLAGVMERWSTAYISRTKSFHNLLQGIDLAEETVVSVRVGNLVTADCMGVLGGDCAVFSLEHLDQDLRGNEITNMCYVNRFTRLPWPCSALMKV